MGLKVFKESVWLFLLAGACGLIIWHVFSWQSSGRYDEMYQGIANGKGHVTALYNLALMLVFGLMPGLLTSRLMETLTSLNNRGNNRK